MAAAGTSAATGCGSCDEASLGSDPVGETAESQATPVRAPAPAPSGLVFEASLGGGAETLAALRGLVGRHPIGVVFPTGPAEVIAGLVPGLPVGDAVPDDAPVHLIGIRRGPAPNGQDAQDEVTLVGATRVRTEPGAAAIPGLVPGGPEGALWVGEAPPADAPAAAVINDVVVFGERRDAVEAALAYLAFTRMPRETPAGLHARIPDGFSAELRSRGEQMMGEVTADLLRQATEERARHDSPPDFGEPEVVARHLARGAGQLLGLLSDIGEVRASLVPVVSTTSAPSGQSVRVVVDGAVRPGSALAELLTNAPVGDTSGTRALPANTALALSFFPERSEDAVFDAFAFFRGWREFAGSRLDRRGDAAIDALEEAWETAAGRESIVAAGGGADDAWVATIDPAPESELLPAAVESVAKTSYVATMLADAFDCPPRTTPRRGEPLCPGAPSFVVSENENRRVIGLARAPALFEAGDHASVGAYPEVSRALDMLGTELVVSLMVIPSRLMPVLGLSGAAALQQISRVSTMAARPSPIALGIGRRPRTESDGPNPGVRITLIAPDRAIADALTVIGSI